MNIKLENKLCQRFKFYKPYRNPRDSLMYFGFECDSGWFDLIWKLSESIEKELSNLSEKERKSFEVLQCKEKFGKLRFYTNLSIDKIDKLIFQAEKDSGRICELCGKVGHIRGNYWLKTLCDKCMVIK